MDPKGFCSWLQGVLDMAEGEDGGVTFTQLQYSKIYTNLKEALEGPEATTAPDQPHFSRPDGARC